MKTRKGEPVIVVPEEQQQIVELERQLAEANTRIETLTRRLEAAGECAEAWEEAALRKAGKAEYDWMEKNRRYEDVLKIARKATVARWDLIGGMPSQVEDLRDALDRLEALDKPEVQDEGKGGQT